MPPVEAPTTTTFSVVSIMALVARCENRRRRSAWARPRELASQSLQPRLAAALTASQSSIRDSSRNCLVPMRGFAMMSTAPYSSALQRGLRALLGQARTHHHRDGVLAHDLLEEGDAVHPRHLDVEGDDVRHLLADPFGGHEGIGGRRHDLDLGSEDRIFGQGLADHRRVVDDEDANFRLLLA